MPRWKYYDFECGCGIVLTNHMTEEGQEETCPECGDVMKRLPNATNAYFIGGDNSASTRPREGK